MKMQAIVLSQADILMGEFKLSLQNICLIRYSAAQSVCEKHYKQPLESLMHKKDTLYAE